jgi:MFS transporter, Spinster family, sphingosine-1-phosphate transporter
MSQSHDPAGIPMANPAHSTGTYKHYMLAVLLLVSAFNFVDRFVLGLVLQDIKVDLSLSDTQLGVLTGIAFAVFYSLMGIPLARWADRGNRVTIIVVTTALWSASVALCGAAGSFLQLLLIRIGVAVGEAGCMPPAHSLIADYFSRAERPRAVARYMSGTSLAYIIGFLVAGWLNEIYGWRQTFVLMGLPGLALAALAWLTLREPRKIRTVTRSTASIAEAPRACAPAIVAVQPSVGDVIRALWGNGTFRQLLLCFSVLCFAGVGIGSWKPAFFMRSFGMQSGELGTWFAGIYGLGGILGMYLGGEWASRYAARNERLQLRVTAIAVIGFGAVSAGIYLSQNVYLAFVLLAVSWIGGNSVNGPLFATIQTLVPQRMRAMSIALVYLFANLIGMGLGPLVVGALSDAFRGWSGEDSLRYALLTMCPIYLISAGFLWRASRTVAHDVQLTQRENESHEAQASVRNGIAQATHVSTQH